jgi:hypothetical protein
MGFRASLNLYTEVKAPHPLGIACLIVALGAGANLRADDPLLKQLFDRQRAAAIEEAKSPHKHLAATGSRILVLADGRVVEGIIRADLHGYHLETPDANLYFSFDQVQLVARDRQEAYQKMCASNPGNLAQRDLRLGRWCLENRLPHEAAFHLRKVLEAEPGNQQAKALLVRLEESQAPGTPVAAGAPEETAAPDAKVVESLARLSPGTVREFVLGVQPILMARCGSTRCHGGPAETSFRLGRVYLSAGGNRQMTSKNLEAVLHEVDPQFVRRSSLLQHAIEAHGGALHPPLTGGAAELQKARIIAWLTNVAPELKQMKQEEASRHAIDKVAQAGKPEPHRDAFIVPVSAIGRQSNGASPEAKSTGLPAATFKPPATFTPPAAEKNLAEKKTPEPKTADKAGNDLGPLTDPFDPAQFNKAK